VPLPTNIPSTNIQADRKKIIKTHPAILRRERTIKGFLNSGSLRLFFFLIVEFYALDLVAGKPLPQTINKRWERHPAAKTILAYNH
jgi:hypothetical protein